MIGKNNSGKSSLLDLIDYLVSPKDIRKLKHRNGDSKVNRDPEVFLTKQLSEYDLKAVFDNSISSMSIGGGGVQGNHWEYGKKFIDAKITISIKNNTSQHFINLDPPFETDGMEDYEKKLAETVINPFNHKIFKRLGAERDIVPEPDHMPVSDQVYENGTGATHIVHEYLHELATELVTENLLGELNNIFEPESHFDEIIIRRLEANKWEIYLKEKEKKYVALSESGSGLKTVLLVLIYTILIPDKENKNLGDCIFAFEELENNLHPALQRRLFSYIKDLAENKKATFFITTHSNVVIDLFSDDPLVQIYHVRHNGKEAISKPVNTYIESGLVLDDLGIRASDILQSNGVIWVEGPTDKIYVNKWIELWSHDKWREGAHYQCLIYGGGTLPHFSADTTQNDDDLIKILTLNRNVIVVMDSDKRTEDNEISKTKRRIQTEVKRTGGICWITKGREIENYIPKSALSDCFNTDIETEIGQYEKFPEYLNNVISGVGNQYKNNKVTYAKGISDKLTNDNRDKLDLNDRMNEVVSEIEKWNSMN